MSYRSPLPGVEIPEVPLQDLVLGHARERGDKVALVDGSSGQSLTYRQLVDDVGKAAAGLARLGVGKGDVVSICSPNCPDYVVAFLACATLGAVTTPVNPLYRVAELLHQLRDSGARVLIAGRVLEPTAREAAGRAGLTHLVTFDAAREGSFRGLLRHGDPVPAPALDVHEDVVALPYSSGAGDLATGVMLTHYNLAANVVQTGALEQVDGDAVLIGAIPFHEMSGLVVVSLGLQAGATIVTLSRFDLRCLLDVLGRYRVTSAYVVPGFVRMLTRRPDISRDVVPALRQVVSSTTPLSAHLAQACRERYSCEVRQAYGLPEAGGFTHVAPEGRGRATSVGVVVPNTEFRIVHVASQSDVPPGEIGEVWIRGPQIMKGYVNNPDLTRCTVDQDRWLHTGDIGYSDADGYLHVVEHARDLVRLRGLQHCDDELLMATIDEVASRREAAEQLAFQAVLLDSVRESVVGTDLQSRVTFWNKGAERLFGFSTDEAMGQPVNELIVPPEEDERVRLARTTALRTQGRWNAQVLRRRKDGSVLWTDLVVSTVRNEDGERSGFIGIHRDITEQKRVEARLRFQAQLLDSVRESVVATDIGDRVVFWGKGAEQLFGHSAGEMLGRHVAPLVVPNQSAVGEFTGVKQEMMQKGVWGGQIMLSRRDGSQFWADIALAPVCDEEGRKVGLIAIHRDVTDLQRNQDLLKDSHERLRNLAARLLVIREQERSAIARELHDELGQALTRLTMDLSWLTERLPRPLRTKRARDMEPLVKRMLETVQHISSELRPAILDDLGLEAAVEWHAQEFANWAGCRCKLDLHIGALPRDRDRDIAVFRILQEALTNIARHARAHTVCIRARVAGSEFRLEVEDDGIGIPDERLASAHSLGLIGMRERAEGLGGSIHIGASGSRGTIVALILRVGEPALARA